MRKKRNETKYHPILKGKCEDKLEYTSIYLLFLIYYIIYYIILYNIDYYQFIFLFMNNFKERAT